MTETTHSAQPTANSAQLRTNPLIAAAEPLLLAVALIRQSQAPESVTTLQQNLLDGLDDFHSSCGNADCPPQQLEHAEYALCALLDETALSTRWGGSLWPPMSLLQARFDQHYSGNEFFDRLNQIVKLRQQGTDLMEFYHLCLSLGYSGQFHPRRHTAAVIEGLREQLSNLLYQYRAPPPTLSNARPVVHQTGRQRLPVWVAAAVAGAILLGFYQLFDVYLGTRADKAEIELRAISRPDTIDG